MLEKPAANVKYIINDDDQLDLMKRRYGKNTTDFIFFDKKFTDVQVSLDNRYE